MVIELSPRSFINLNDKTIDILYPGRGTIAVAKGKITNKICINEKWRLMLSYEK